MRKFLLFWLALVTMGLAGCGSGTEGGAGPGASGPSPSKKLIDLTDAEKGQVCDWTVAKFGDYPRRDTRIREPTPGNRRCTLGCAHGSS